MKVIQKYSHLELSIRFSQYVSAISDKKKKTKRRVTFHPLLFIHLRLLLIRYLLQNQIQRKITRSSLHMKSNFTAAFSPVSWDHMKCRAKMKNNISCDKNKECQQTMVWNLNIKSLRGETLIETVKHTADCLLVYDTKLDDSFSSMVKLLANSTSLKAIL